VDDNWVTTILDVLALLLVAAGVGWYAWDIHHGLGLAMAGLVVGGGGWSAAAAAGRARARRKARE